jgi:hypothetical protein
MRSSFFIGFPLLAQQVKSTPGRLMSLHTGKGGKTEDCINKTLAQGDLDPPVPCSARVSEPNINK